MAVNESVSPRESEREPQVDPRDLARSVAIEVAEEPEQVGDVVDAIDLGDGVTDFRMTAHIRGYEGWQWSVTLYHDEELDRWTVNESSLIPTSDALMPPAWVPWKDRLEPTDLAPTDSIGTDPDDPRLEDGFRRTEPKGDAADSTDSAADGEGAVENENTTDDASDVAADSAGESGVDDGDADAAAASDGEDAVRPVDSEEDIDEAVEEFDLSRRHVMSPLGRAQTAKRWYEGPRGPKAMSTKTAAGNLCSTCGFFVPLKGELNLLFGVCANKWSPDDGRVVSLDHGCGEHSEIEPPEPTHLWVQSKPAFDDLHIDIVAQRPREDRSQIELLESQDDTADEVDDTADDTDDADEAVETDIEENTEIDADSEDVTDNTVPDDDTVPEVEAVIDLAGETETDSESDPDDEDDTDDIDDVDSDGSVDSADSENEDDSGDEDDSESAEGEPAESEGSDLPDVDDDPDETVTERAE
ncbi:DUF3027 domain-containing protein [Bifidobacterium rousetti]|uniref:DUF3027 domain-containing protein n=1 Tax=Bifidobacterium rousetti TaxID=2045439 RepID=UPI0012393159|nr:DUF3027 domain-containing protein [Bifidobacterium rousetti]KAA8818007.1 DUF3027 domain-containing protein [Bifidobacterium rousetti]